MEEFEKRAKERAARDKEKAEEDEARALGNSPRSVAVLKLLHGLLGQTPILTSRSSKQSANPNHFFFRSLFY